MSSDDLNREIAFAGQRVKQKVIFALTLASVIPLLILTYAFQAPVRVMLGPLSQYTEAFTMPALLLFTGLLMAGGGFVVWDVASRHLTGGASGHRHQGRGPARGAAPQGRDRHPHELVRQDARHHRAADGRDQPVPRAGSTSSPARRSTTR